MATEIERKFLIKTDGWRDAVISETRLVQGYLVSQPGLTLRVRIAGGQAMLTLKGATSGISRAEYEYPIPLADAEAMLATLVVGPTIEKTRHCVRHGAHVWELDIFAGANAGLALAEIELGSPDEPFEHPAWAGAEVSDDPRYYNANLVRHPFRDWDTEPVSGAVAVSE